MYRRIIKFWFEDVDSTQWFKKDEKFDHLITLKFSDAHKQATKGELFSWRNTSLGMLAEIILLDQFSRNMYRDMPESFAYDSLALILAQSMISGGHDLELTPQQRSFIYMPFMHSESLIIHQEALTLFTKLGIESTLKFEHKHKVIIERFGRYPHRNKLLGRTSTKEEIEFLTQSGSSF